MNTAQRIVKYLALALAIAIIVGIVGGGLKLLGGIVLVEDLSSSVPSQESKTVSDFIDELEIDVTGVKLSVKIGSAFSVETDNPYINCVEKGTRLVITERPAGWLKREGGTLTVCLPRDRLLKEVEIDGGAGEIELSGLQIGELDLSLGAGKTVLADLSVSQKAEIDGGAGQIILQDSTIQNLDMDLGVGELNFTARLTGKSQIDCGIGKVDLMLIDPEAYSIRLDKGVGEATYRGEPMKNGTVYGTGEAWVEIDGGIGSITIDLAELGIED